MGASGVSFFFVIIIIVFMLIYGSEANKIDEDIVYLYNEQKQKLLRLKNFVL